MEFMNDLETLRNLYIEMYLTFAQLSLNVRIQPHPNMSDISINKILNTYLASSLLQ